MKYELLEDKDWGMRWARPPREQVMPVPEIYVHQTAGRDPRLMNLDAATSFESLNEYAINTKMYSAVDYSMLVHTDMHGKTTIGEARGQWLPAATLDRNAVSKAVCLFGWFGPPDPAADWTKTSSRPPLLQEIEAIAEAIVWMIGQGWVVTNPVIRGHRDNPSHPFATACPGDYLEAELWRIRMLVAQMQQPVPTPTPEDEMSKVIVDFQRTNKAGVKYSGGSFTLEGIPLDGPVREELIKQGWVAVKSSHEFWRAAVMHRNGPMAERLYADFEDTQDLDND